MGGNNYIDPVIADYLFKDMKMVGSVEAIMQQRAFEREQGRFFDTEAGGPGLAPAHVKMGNVDLVMPCQFLEDIVMP
jgi:hypothetical protein